MNAVLSLLAGLLLTLVGWLGARRVAGARLRGPLLILLHDALVPFATFLVVLLATGRPLLGGAVALGAFGGFAFADRVKRATLREPIVFTDMAELVELLRHPQFYLPFAGTGRVIIGAVAVAAVYAVILILRQPIFPITGAWTVSVLAAAFALVLFCANALVKPWAGLLRRFAPSGDPILDARRFGPFAMIGCYGIIARAERNGRRAALPPVGDGIALAQKPPVILVQSESFFDPARLGLDEDFLPAFAAARRQSQWGRLAVPCWGANTARSEFSALTGLGQAEIGYDLLNPYHAFTKKPVPSLAWFFKAQGYRTVCIHPFDLGFYGRNRIMPRLGFDVLLGQEAFAATGPRGYITDAAVAEHVAGLVAASVQPLFVFVISMENHGPWKPGVGLPLPLKAAQAPDAKDDGLGEYLQTLKGADALIARLTAALEQDGRGGLLGFYGDHMPSLPGAFTALDFHDTDTDYLLWRAGHDQTSRRDLAVASLARELLMQIRR